MCEVHDHLRNPGSVTNHRFCLWGHPCTPVLFHLDIVRCIGNYCSPLLCITSQDIVSCGPIHVKLMCKEEIIPIIYKAQFKQEAQWKSMKQCNSCMMNMYRACHNNIKNEFSALVLEKQTDRRKMSQGMPWYMVMVNPLWPVGNWVIDVTVTVDGLLSLHCQTSCNIEWPYMVCNGSTLKKWNDNLGWQCVRCGKSMPSHVDQFTVPRGSRLQLTCCDRAMVWIIALLHMACRCQAPGHQL